MDLYFLPTWFVITSYRNPNFKIAWTKYRNWRDGSHMRIVKSQVRICNIRRAIVMDFWSSCRAYRKYKKSVHSLDQCFPTSLPWWDKYFFTSRGNLVYENICRSKIKQRLVAQGRYYSTANCRTKLPSTFGIFMVPIFMYFCISRYLAETLIMFCGILGFRKNTA